MSTVADKLPITLHYCVQHNDIVISLCLCCSILDAPFSNLTKFECSPRHDDVPYTYDIFHNKYKIPDKARCNMSDLHMQTEKHLLTLLKNPITL